MKTFVLCKVRSGALRDTLNAVRRLEDDHVTPESAYALAGIYDIIVIFDAHEPKAVGRFVVDKIQKIPGIIQTITLNDASVFDKTFSTEPAA